MHAVAWQNKDEKTKHTSLESTRRGMEATAMAQHW